MKFVKPDGSDFDLNYLGTIHCVDSGNDLVAICSGGTPFSISDNKIEQGDIGEPDNWDDWSIVISISDSNRTILQKSIASLWQSRVLCETILIKLSQS